MLCKAYRATPGTNHTKQNQPRSTLCQTTPTSPSYINIIECVGAKSNGISRNRHSPEQCHRPLREVPDSCMAGCARLLPDCRPKQCQLLFEPRHKGTFGRCADSVQPAGNDAV